MGGGDGNDLLDGGTGNDSMIGNFGDDTYVVDSANDYIIERVGQGNDTILSSVNYTLRYDTDVENLTLTGNAIIGTGNDLNNLIIGNGSANVLNGLGGNDTIDGGAGNDTMTGGTGNDVYMVDARGDVVSEGSAVNDGTDTVFSSISYTLSANVENLMLTGSENLFGNGSELNNVIMGNAGNNDLQGLDGNDTIHGGDGNDQFYGGKGNDSLLGGAGGDNIMDVDGGDDVLYGEDGADQLSSYAGNDVLYGGVGNDNLLAGADQDTLYGGADDDLMRGGDGNDLLDGGTGSDNMIGNFGDDTYVVDSGLDAVFERVGEGYDTVLSSVDFTLRQNTDVENLTLTGNAIIGTGNDLSNTIIGNGSDNVLSGLVGNDTIDGGAGNDALHGGTGHDILTGGDGADTFVFDTNGGLDRITDFISGSDHIQIAATLVRTLGGTGALTAQSFYAADDAVAGHDADDRLIYDTKTGALYYDADGSNAGAAVQIAVLDMAGDVVPMLQYEDFIFG